MGGGGRGWEKGHGGEAREDLCALLSGKEQGWIEMSDDGEKQA